MKSNRQRHTVYHYGWVNLYCRRVPKQNRSYKLGSPERTGSLRATVWFVYLYIYLKQVFLLIHISTNYKFFILNVLRKSYPTNQCCNSCNELFLVVISGYSVCNIQQRNRAVLSVAVKVSFSLMTEIFKCFVLSEHWYISACVLWRCLMAIFQSHFL